jgi:hypothetical protein
MEREEQINELAKLRFKNEARSLRTSDLKWFSVKAWFVHVFGIHTWLPLEIWDLEAMSIQNGGVVCYVCHRKG